MAAQEDITQQKAKKKDQSFFGNMSGMQKALLLIFALAMFFLIWTFVFGGIANFYQLIFFVVSFVAIGGLFYVVLFFISWYLAPELFSPKKDYYTKLVNLAIDLKPNNVFDLYFKGNRDKKRVKAGKIIGLLGIPYLVGKPKIHKMNVYEGKKPDFGKQIAKKGEPVFEYSTVLNRKIPAFEKIEYAEDGDTLFIYESGWLFMKRRHYLRCHKSLHGDLHGDVEIYDINPVPYGSFFEYPFKQIQEQPSRTMIQTQMEIILATHEHQYDLISQGVDAAVYFNPYFRLLQKSQAEMTSE